MAIVCSVCGTENPDGTQYCEGCGVELSAPAAPVETPKAEAAPEAPAAPVETTPEAEAAPAAPPVETPKAEAAPEAPAAPVETAPAPAAPAATFRNAKMLIKRYGAVTEEGFPLQGQRMLVGRFDPTSGPVDIDLADLPGSEHISRHHGEIYFESGQWKVRDLGSTNGVFVRKAGQSAFSPRLVEPAALGDGDEVAFGNVSLVFREG